MIQMRPLTSKRQGGMVLVTSLLMLVVVDHSRRGTFSKLRHR